MVELKNHLLRSRTHEMSLTPRLGPVTDDNSSLGFPVLLAQPPPFGKNCRDLVAC